MCVLFSGRKLGKKQRSHFREIQLLLKKTKTTNNPVLREMYFIIITWQGPYEHPWFWNLLNLHFLASIP